MRSGRRGRPHRPCRSTYSLPRSNSIRKPTSRFPLQAFRHPCAGRKRRLPCSMRQSGRDRRRRHHQCDVRSSHRIRRDHQAFGRSTLMGWGGHPGHHPLDGRQCVLQTSTVTAMRRCSPPISSSASAIAGQNRHTGNVPTYTEAASSSMSISSRRRSAAVFAPDFGIVSDAGARSSSSSTSRPNGRLPGKLRDWSAWAEECRERKRTYAAQDPFDQTPLKPSASTREEQGLSAAHLLVSTIGLSQIAAQFLQVQAAQLDQLRPGLVRSVGRCRQLSRAGRRSEPEIVALSGDYGFSVPDRGARGSAPSTSCLTCMCREQFLSRV